VPYFLSALITRKTRVPRGCRNAIRLHPERIDRFLVEQCLIAHALVADRLDRDADFLFELTHLLAQRRLRGMQRLRRASKVTVFGDGYAITGAVVNAGITSSANRRMERIASSCGIVLKLICIDA
jgi:hypothetical protein